MSLHSDFFPGGGDDLIPGDIIDTPSNYIADGINYIDITDGVLVDKSLFPKLDANLFVSNWSASTLEQYINNPVPTAGAFFGNVSMYGDTLAIGAQYDDIGAGGSGAVYVYTRSGGVWTLEQTIPNPTPAANDGFGISVSLFQDSLLISTHYDEDGGALNWHGAAYFYSRVGTTWSLDNTFLGTLDYQQLGISSEIYNDTAVVGSPSNTGGEKAYVYTRTNSEWSLFATLSAPTAGDFGGKVAIYGDTIIVSAYTAGTGGIVYVYRKEETGVVLKQTINNPTAVAADLFGFDVAIYGNTMVIGAKWEDTGADKAGTAYVYEYIIDTWVLQQTIHNPTPITNAYFADQVTLYQDTVAINGAGKVYIYNKVGLTWTLEHTITGVSDEKVSLFGNSLAIGNFYDDTGAVDAGSVSVFTAADANTFYIQGQDKVLKVK